MLKLLSCRGAEGVFCQVWRDCRGDGDEGPHHQALQVRGGEGEGEESQNIIYFRGFGFVTFADVGGVDKVLAQNSHDLDGKKVGGVIESESLQGQLFVLITI